MRTKPYPGRHGRGVLLVTGTVTAITLLNPLMAGIASASTHLSRAVEIRLPSNSTVSSASFLFGVGCVRIGSCVAGGTYYDSSGNHQAMVVSESGGHWARASEVKLPSNAHANPFAEVNSVACTGVGSCVAAGYYNGDTLFQGFIVTESHGTWGLAREPALPVNSAASSDFQLNAMACTGPGSCVVIGDYKDSSGGFQAMVVTESKGTWKRATELTMPANARSDPEAFFLTVSCARTGSCVAGGDYTDKSGDHQAAAVTESAGKWRKGVEIKLPAGAAANPKADFNSVSCTGIGSCIAVGSYFGTVGNAHSFTVTESRGSWAPARKFTMVPSNAAAAAHPFLSSIACPHTGSCLAVGGYTDKAGGFASFAAVESGGKWTGVSQVLPPSNATMGAHLASGSRAVSCTATGYCADVGIYSTASGYRAMAATTP